MRKAYSLLPAPDIRSPVVSVEKNTNPLCSAYSAHEHSALTSHLLTTTTTTTTTAGAATGSSSPPSPPPTSLPLDIVLETLISLFALCVGLVLGAPALKPIAWRVWAADVDHGAVKKASDVGGQTTEADAWETKEGDGGFGWLERGGRKGFVDIRVSGCSCFS